MKYFIRVLIILSIFFLSGCATAKFSRDRLSKDGTAHYISGVPFVEQKQNMCGPSAMASVMKYWGFNATQDEIASLTYLPQIKGTLNLDLENYAVNKGFWTESYKGSLADLRSKIDGNFPVIVLKQEGIAFLNKYHYIVVIGYNDKAEYVVAYTGTNKDQCLAYKSFLSEWQAADNWTLIVCPPDKISWKLSADECVRLGLLCERNGDFRLAVDAYNNALKDQVRPDILFDLGNAYSQSGRLSRAISAYEEALKEYPDYADCLNNLACAYIEKGDNLEKAEELINSALRTNPNGKVYYMDSLGLLRLKQKRYNDAEGILSETLNAADEKKDIKALIYYHLGLVYIDTGDLGRAKTVLEKSIELNPASEAREKLNNLTKEGSI